MPRVSLFAGCTKGVLLSEMSVFLCVGTQEVRGCANRVTHYAIIDTAFGRVCSVDKYISARVDGWCESESFLKLNELNLPLLVHLCISLIHIFFFAKIPGTPVMW